MNPQELAKPFISIGIMKNNLQLAIAESELDSLVIKLFQGRKKEGKIYGFSSI